MSLCAHAAPEGTAIKPDRDLIETILLLQLNEIGIKDSLERDTLHLISGFVCEKVFKKSRLLQIRRLKHFF